MAEELRRTGRKVVFTNGCFDLIHPGHVHLLVVARMAGDHLMVGVNADETIRELKGPPRPLMTLEDRIFVLSAFRWINSVVPFKEDTPDELIRAVRPDVLVKGSEYEKADIVGADFVESYGGEVRRVRMLGSLSPSGPMSTSKLIERIRHAGESRNLSSELT
jgi:D-beta-D-heptose 7-phosphate kinase/D-beta-D-heptose 1-phosphate adenosyltransferase